MRSAHQKQACPGSPRPLPDSRYIAGWWVFSLRGPHARLPYSPHAHAPSSYQLPLDLCILSPHLPAHPLPRLPSHQHPHPNVAPCFHPSHVHHLSAVFGHTWSVSPRPAGLYCACPRLSRGSHRIRMDEVSVSCPTDASNHCHREAREDSASYPALGTLPRTLQFLRGPRGGSCPGES